MITVLLAMAAASEQPPAGLSIMPPPSHPFVYSLRAAPPVAAALPKIEKPYTDNWSQEAAPIMSAWEECLLQHGVRWASQHDGADVLAQAAFGACTDPENAYRRMLYGATINGRIVFDTAQAEDLVANFKATWTPRVIAAIVEQRADHPAAARRK